MRLKTGKTMEELVLWVPVVLFGCRILGLDDAHYSVVTWTSQSKLTSNEFGLPFCPVLTFCGGLVVYHRFNL